MYLFDGIAFRGVLNYENHHNAVHERQLEKEKLLKLKILLFYKFCT